MNGNDLFQLNDWVVSNRTWIMGDQHPTNTAIREKAEAELKIKCPAEPLKACMERNEIPVRRSRHETEVLLLKQEKQELEDLVIELWNQANLPPDLAASFRHRIEKLGGRVLDVMKRQQPVAC